VGDQIVEMNKIEVAAIEKLNDQIAETSVAELDELQLALVGGGIGIVIVG